MICGILFVLDSLLFVAVSHWGPADAAETPARQFGWAPAKMSSKDWGAVAWYQDHRVLSALLIFLSVVIVLTWW